MSDCSDNVHVPWMRWCCKKHTIESQSEAIANLATNAEKAMVTYNEACFLANNVFATYSANYHRMCLAAGLAEVVAVDHKMAELGQLVLELKAIKFGVADAIRSKNL